MKIAVFDTWVRRPDGRAMHFDILVTNEPAHRDPAVVLAHGRRYLAGKGLPPASLEARECRFCHTEPASPAQAAQIARDGFGVVELENCD